jgi:putative transposase
MPHSLLRLWIHAVWTTKNRTPLLPDSSRTNIMDHIKLKFEELGCRVLIINGTKNHLHALFLLCNDRSVAEVMKMVKGESSHWINQQNFFDYKFAWQTGYGCFSVSESMVKRVEEYIRTQEEHHKKMTFQEEYGQFLQRHGLHKPMNRLGA